MASSLPNQATANLDGSPKLRSLSEELSHTESGPLDGRLEEILSLDSAKIRDANDAFIDQFTNYITQPTSHSLSNLLNDSPMQLVPLKRTPHAQQHAQKFNDDSLSYADRIGHHLSVSDPQKLSHYQGHLKSGSAGSNHQDVYHHSHSSSINLPLPPFKTVQSQDITSATIDHFYRLFIQTYHAFNGQNANCVLNEHFVKIANPPKYQKRTFNLYEIYAVAKLTNSLKHATSWCEIARHLGFDTKGTNIAARIKDWVVQNHVSSFCDYLLGEDNSFFMVLKPGEPPHDIDPIPMRKRGRPKGSDVIKNEKRIKAHAESMTGDYPDAQYLDMNRSYENSFGGMIEYEGEDDEVMDGVGRDMTRRTSNRHTVDFTSDDALGERKSAADVLQGIAAVLSEDVGEVVSGCLKDVKEYIVGLQREVERLRRENGDLHRVVGDVVKLCKTAVRK